MSYYYLCVFMGGSAAHLWLLSFSIQVTEIAYCPSEEMREATVPL